MENNYYTPFTPPAPSGLPQPPAAPKPQQPKRAWTGARAKDIIYAILLCIFSIFLFNCAVGKDLGAGTSIFASAVYISTFIYLWKERRHFSIYTVISALLFLICAAGFAFSDAEMEKVLSALSMAALYGVTVMDMYDLRRRRPGCLGSVADLCNTVFIRPFDGIAESMWALFHKKDGDGVKKKKGGAIILGLICAFPVLCVVVPILIVSDAAFYALVEKLGALFDARAAVSVIFGTAMAILLFSQAFSSKAQSVRKIEKKDKKGIEPAAICSFMCALLFAYALYLLSQLAYFFNAFAGILLPGYTMAGYARRGFFEMCIVCVINLLIVFVCMLISRKKDGEAPKTVRIPALFICLFSLLLIATAVSKMVMYINSYGMTRLRIVTSLFMIFLAIVFIAAILKLFIKKMPYMQITLIAGSAIIAFAVFADIDRVIASYNINAYLSGSLESIDLHDIRYLDSDAVVPYVVKLTDDQDENIANYAESILCDHLLKNFDVEDTGNGPELKQQSYLDDYDLRCFNTAELEARKILFEHRQELLNRIEDEGRFY